MNRYIATFLCAAAVTTCMSTAHADETDTQLCLTQKHIQNGLANAQVVQNAAKTNPALTTIAHEGFSYLPEGFPQQAAGYDSCPLTGSGYTYDHTVVQPTKYLHECDEQGPRAFKINCQTGVATFDLTAEQNTAAGDNEHGNNRHAQAKTVDFIPGQTQVCKRGVGKNDPETEATTFMSPSCERPLSSFQLEGYYPACQKTSQTYRACFAVLGGNLRISDKGSGRERGDENFIRGGFCALPQGTKVIDHATALNAAKDQQFKNDSTFAVKQLQQSLEMLNAKLRERKVDCSKVKTF
ncbi:MAG: hypothetical protein GC134_06580 [Proteobacteria bacterium]|nr:hypothetical protein [Pseudomonadota bacterium]